MSLKCIVCGQKFIKVYGKQLCCSKKCSRVWRDISIRIKGTLKTSVNFERREAALKTFKCCVCGGQSQREESRVVIKYCSDKCNQKHYQQKIAANGKQAEYNRRKKTSPHWKIQHLLRLRFYLVLKVQNARKTNSAVVLLGCSIPQFKTYMEQFFESGMTWENWGKVWHLDHVFPVSWFDLNQPEQVGACFHYTNFQPLFVADNLKKSNRFAGGAYDRLSSQPNANGRRNFDPFQNQLLAARNSELAEEVYATIPRA